MASLPKPQRAFPRHAIDAEVTIARDAVVIARGRSQNLSRGGMCAIVDAALPRGAVVEVSIALVFAADGVSEPITLPARVVWCMGYHDAEQVGLSFLGLDVSTGGYLDMFIRFLAKHDDDDGGRGPADPFDER